MENNEYREILDRINEVKEISLETKTTLTQRVNLQFNEHNRRITKLEDNQRWVALAVIGACITAVMTLILK